LSLILQAKQSSTFRQMLPLPEQLAVVGRLEKLMLPYSLTSNTSLLLEGVGAVGLALMLLLEVVGALEDFNFCQVLQ
jgi:hypothetical protein